MATILARFLLTNSVEKPSNDQKSKGSFYLNILFDGGTIINTILLIGAGTVAISCLFGTIIHLISISNEIQNSEIEDIEPVN